MSNKARRWYCRECKREWIEPRECYANSSPLSITGNPLNGNNCQVCGSPEIELVEFQPEYPGLDIPRDNPNKIIPTEIHTVIPGTTNSKNFSIRSETNILAFPQVQPEQVIEQIEETLVNWTSMI